jgi:hypothetical protein
MGAEAIFKATFVRDCTRELHAKTATVYRAPSVYISFEGWLAGREPFQRK